MKNNVGGDIFRSGIRCGVACDDLCVERGMRFSEAAGDELLFIVLPAQLVS